MLMVAACGADAGAPTTTASEASAAGMSRPTTTQPTSLAVATQGPSAYLVAMANLIAELDIRLPEFAERYGTENPPPSTDEEMFLHSVGFWLGPVDTFLAWTGEVEAITPPGSMALVFDCRQGEFEAGAFVVITQAGEVGGS